MIETYLFIFIIVFLIAATAGLFVMNQRYQRVMKSVVQVTLEKGMLLDRLEKLELENSKEVNDGFIKFLSQSRETAFKYIEDVQLAIQNYADTVGTGSKEDIELARMELFSHLPEVSEDGLENKG